jgi:hypothetical protein
MHVTITRNGWISQVKSQKRRADLMRMIFSLAQQNGYEVRVEGQHWK